MHFRSLADPGGPADLRLLSRLPNLEFLDLGSIETRDTSGLSQLEKLRTFRVMSLDHPFDVSSVCRLPRLRSLNLHARLTHAAALAEMPELESLQIEIHSAKDEDEVRRAVEHCSALRRLAVSCSRAARLPCLKRLNRLVSLAWNDALEDVEALADVPNLTYLNLGSNHGLSEISPVGGLRRLKSLELYHCDEIKDLSVLRHLPALQVLNAPPCVGGSVVSPIARNCPKLEVLTLWKNVDLHDCAPLANLSSLRDLSFVGCNEVKDLGFLSRLPHLHKLRLDVGTDKEGYSPLSSLNEFALSGYFHGLHCETSLS